MVVHVRLENGEDLVYGTCPAMPPSALTNFRLVS